MLKPKKLVRGDKVAVISPSSGLLGEENFVHKFDIAKERLAKDFGLELVAMPHALKGIKYVYEHPEDRAKDIMNAFKDPSIKAIICAIGGADSIRLLPYMDFEVIKNNPKIFMGYSDVTSVHFMMRKAGINTFYGPTIMAEISEYTRMFPYTENAIRDMLFTSDSEYEIKPAGVVCNEFLPWGIENVDKCRNVEDDPHGYELLQGDGVVEGTLWGGCIDMFQTLNGSPLWPTIDEWKDTILCIETSEEHMHPDQLACLLRGLGVQGIFDVVNGIIVGKPHQSVHYDEYKDVIKKVVGFEYGRPDLPILYNVNFGHGSPIGIIPLGVRARIDSEKKSLTLIENWLED